MFRDWWMAHRFEFAVFGVICVMAAVVFGLYALALGVKRLLRNWRRRF